jgi:ornithine cyclodeaminase
MLFIDAERMRALLDYPSLVDAFQDYHLQDVDALDELLLTQPGSSDQTTYFFLRAAWQREQALGAKLITVFPDNVTASEALPSVQAVYVIFDGTNGKPLACIDGTALTYCKTAADSALGARFLARKDTETMLMVGAGAMAPHLITAHAAVRPSIRRVLIWNRTPGRATELAKTLELENTEIIPTRDLEGSAHAADLISCATMSPTPLIKGAWLKPGVHLDLVGGFTKAMRETDDDAVRKAIVYVDFRDTARHCGDISAPIETGIISADDIAADLFELCRGERKGREQADEITFFKNGGGGHLDLMTARFLLTRFREQPL